MSDTLYADLVLLYMGRTVTYKGDVPGHPFRGNQYGEGQGGDGEDSSGSGGSSAHSQVRSEYESHHPIVKRAITEGVSDIGQLSKDEKKILNRHIKKGHLTKVPDTFSGGKPRRYVPTFDYLNKLNAAYNQ